MEWITWTEIDEFLREIGVEFYYEEDGISCHHGDKKTHLDVYSMENRDGSWGPDWTASPECKIENVKDCLACLFGDEWTEKFKELMP